ncbi:hypothetical protein SELMODRAFT_141704 [Selaginella moellendorffii]|uniref:DUF1068 domain-containing protein n=1 Tax=Selaginella moellendorffii TaxID=88036 RepID=D8QY97_SELML|nr:uncharacterized protein LOC9655233 [Selaginella moellendorffii]EFJ35161.1 hypothetical protein SELMODRAFT_141704 [Selaginella moellendorffii]|eukprot:XP_002963290.1 uncharacterized protein LOC9655233 [Selaginella moellendorffii]
MAQQSGPSSSRVKLMIFLLALALGMYIVGPPLYWQLQEGAASSIQVECPVCSCDCLTSNLVTAAVSNLGNLSLLDCSRDDPEMREELDKNRLELLNEDLKLQEMVAEDDRRRAEMALVDAKKLSSQYQKEAEKCNIGMETSEEAREKAEAALGEMRKVAALWEERARRLGWKDSGDGEANPMRRRALKFR